MPRVNPEILAWARTTAGLDEAEAAGKLGIGDARGVPAANRLRALESGEEEPSRALLTRMAKQYRRPLVVFYLSTPPRRGNRGQDFRTLPQDAPVEGEALLDALIRDVQARQSLIKSALLDEQDAEPVTFVSSFTTADGSEAIRTSIRNTLAFSLEEYRSARNVDAAFTALRERVEAAGVFVLLVGNLGSHHTNIDLETFRGFALADPIAPFVVINDQDHHAAWSFTLLHELTHLWLGQTGISGGRPEQSIERFCNDVASELLLPSAELGELDALEALNLEESAARLAEFASARNVSQSMVAYRLYRADRISLDKWRALSAHLRDRWLSERERRRERSRDTEGGANYYVVKRHRLGPALIGVTARLMAAGALTTTKAGAVLGVKPKNVGGVLREHLAGAS